MELYKGFLFHNRYLLVSTLGCGASAEVWKAKDTKANNLTVALKIFSQHSEMDSYGLQNFEREFTTVYNMKHSNLLPPTGYDIYEGRPYLVMQYCENGSCSSMVGRMEEDDLIKFLHDVSAGLEYLHDHNIIHQDIKPDNILLDDNCNFMVTDFGISVNSDNGIHTSNGMSGGTRAYMGPERFEGITNNASDMWALGATAVELLTGNPPYGEHGGLLQKEGEPLPELPKLQPEVKGIIMRCLAEDPMKRIKANEIRQKIELYWETGSWVKHSSKQTFIIAATGIVAVLMCLGIFLWDYNRVKVYYYKDYSEYNGVPQGIGRLSSNVMKHRESSYKFEYRRHRLIRLSLVNSAGRVINHSDTEHMNSRSSEVHYFYTADGKIDYKEIYDSNGRVLCKMDYDENLKTVTFRQIDEYGTEMNLAANTNVLYKNNSSVFDEKSHITRYLLTYNEDGLLVERRYAGLQNTLACDESKIYGQRYKYDEKGRKIEEMFIGADGQITSDKNGLAIKTYTYDDNDDWTSVSYLNVERGGAHDGNNCSLVKLEYDKYGNRIKELYYTLDGIPVIRTDLNVSGFSYTHDEHGFRVTQSCIGTDGKLAYCNAGFVSIKDSCNENGFIVRRVFLDENGKPTLYNKPNEDSYSSETFVPNETGLPLEMSYFDEQGDPMENASGVFRFRFAYDKSGNITSLRYYDKDDKPAKVDGFYSEMRMEYDDVNRMTREYYLDDKGKITTSDGTIAEYKLEYNRQGAVTKMSFLDTKGKLVEGANLYACYTVEYDERGNQKSIQYFNADEKPCMSNGYFKEEYTYDPRTNFLITVNYYDVKGKLVSDIHYKYDVKGNIIESYTLVNGQLKPGTAVEKSEYDAYNRQVKVWYCNLDGSKVNNPQTSYSLIKNEYDEKGNLTVVTYWGVDGKPAVDEQKTHKRVHEFDVMNRVVYERNYGIDGKPVSGSGTNPEGKVVYDQWGNRAEISCYDGYGKPKLASGGFFLQKCQFNKRGKLVQEEYFGTDNKLICNVNGYAKANYTYDDHGNQLEAKYFDTSKCIRIETWKYNDKNRFIEQNVYDGNRKLSDQFYGVSRVVISYDSSGVIPLTRKYYNQNGTLIASEKWDKEKNEWAGSSQQSMASSWQESVNNDARQCPYKLENGIYIQSIDYGSSFVRVILKMAEISKYNMGDIDETQLKDAVRTLQRQFRQIWKLPNDVSLRVIMVDKADRTILSI